MKRPAPYVPLSAHYADDEKVILLGEDAELMYVRMLAYAARTPRTEGWVSEIVILTRLGLLEREGDPSTSPRARLDRLAESELIVREGSGYRIASWLKWNRSAEQMDRERTQDRARKQAPTSTNTGNVPEADRKVAGIRGAEADTEADTEGATRPTARRKRPALPLPDSWTPDTNSQRIATERGLDIAHEAMRFRNNALGNDRRQANWDFAFRNWLTSGYAKPQAQAKRGQQPEGW